jgi:putative oligomerization/nucleic acid binding protein
VGILKTAVTAGVASSVHGRIQHRQQQRWAAQDQAAGLAPPSAASPPPQAPAAQAPPAADTGQRLAQLRELGELKTAGILTDAEFEQQEARILNG